MKKTLCVVLSALMAVTACGCKNADGKKKSSPETSSEQASYQFKTEVTKNTFKELSDFEITSDHSNAFSVMLTCDTPDGLEDGIYSSPEVTASAGEIKCDETLGYITVNGEKSVITLSILSGYVKKGTCLTLTATNFNKLREPENETDYISYDDISDETVLEGTLSVTSVCDESFGYFKSDLSQIGGGYITLNELSATITNANGIFKEEPTCEKLTVELADGTEISFDIMNKSFVYDKNGNQTDEYSLNFIFSDETKTIDLDAVTDIRIDSTSVM